MPSSSKTMKPVLIILFLLAISCSKEQKPDVVEVPKTAFTLTDTMASRVQTEAVEKYAHPQSVAPDWPRRT